VLVELYLLLLLVAGVLGLVVAWRYRRRRLVWWAVACGILGGLAGSVLYVALILRHTSSTAAIGVIFVPWIFAVAAVVSAVWGLCLYQLARTTTVLRQGPRAVVLWLAAVTFLGGSAYYGATLASNVLTFRALQDPGAPARVLETRYREALAARNYLQLSAIAANPHTPPAILLEMATSEDPGMHEKREGLATMFDRDALAVVRKVLRNPGMPPEAIPYLAKSKNAYVLGDVAAHRKTPETILRDIAARDDGYLVHWGLAGNPTTPREILERLAGDGDRVTTQNLAGNPSTPLPVLTRLAGSPEQFVRWGVARNPSIDGAIMERLAADPDETVRFYLSFNRAATKETLERLARDPSERVRRYAGEQLARKAR
jgi:hypothetical protein